MNQAGERAIGFGVEDRLESRGAARDELGR
jgi:hypothetical protein